MPPPSNTQIPPPGPSPPPPPPTPAPASTPSRKLLHHPRTPFNRHPFPITHFTHPRHPSSHSIRSPSPHPPTPPLPTPLPNFRSSHHAPLRHLGHCTGRRPPGNRPSQLCPHRLHSYLIIIIIADLRRQSTAFFIFFAVWGQLSLTCVPDEFGTPCAAKWDKLILYIKALRQSRFRWHSDSTRCFRYALHPY